MGKQGAECEDMHELLHASLVIPAQKVQLPPSFPFCPSLYIFFKKCCLFPQFDVLRNLLLLSVNTLHLPHSTSLADPSTRPRRLVVMGPEFSGLA